MGEGEQSHAPTVLFRQRHPTFRQEYIPDAIPHREPTPNNPWLQRLCRAVADARALTKLILTSWTLARCPDSRHRRLGADRTDPLPNSLTSCPACGTAVQSTGMVERQATSLLGPTTL
jgi:hypothetical protein